MLVVSIDILKVLVPDPACSGEGLIMYSSAGMMPADALSRGCLKGKNEWNEAKNI